MQSDNHFRIFLVQDGGKTVIGKKKLAGLVKTFYPPENFMIATLTNTAGKSTLCSDQKQNNIMPVGIVVTSQIRIIENILGIGKILRIELANSNTFHFVCSIQA